MNLPSDPFMLLSMINMRLRDDNCSLDELCGTLGISKSDLMQRLKDAGFDYLPEVNQFR